MPTPAPLLGPDDPAPVETLRPEGASSVVLACEHAGRAIPRRLRSAMPGPDDMDRHIAWDVGARAVALALSEGLDAPLAAQRYSRLVIDCNRPREAPDLCPPVSDGTTVGLNTELSEEDRRERWEAIHQPYHRAVADLLDAREGRPILLATVHSFTPVLAGFARPWHIGLLARRDDRLASLLYRSLERLTPGSVVAFNQPYTIGDESDYTIPVHGEARGLPHVLIEIRNDLIADAEGAVHWAAILETALGEAAQVLTRSDESS